MASSVLVIDQGTTSTRAIVFDADAAPVASAQEEFPQIFPRPGWVEHDPDALWATTLSTAREALRRARLEPEHLAGVGIANQRETTLVWERATGKPIGNAIVWQDRRTADVCASLKASGCEPEVMATTGLVLDPYFSATKIAWLIDSAPGARTFLAQGRGRAFRGMERTDRSLFKELKVWRAGGDFAISRRKEDRAHRHHRRPIQGIVSFRELED